MEDETKVCSICGVKKDVKLFSKSYKSRCKECVSKIAKAKRDKEKKKLRESDMLSEKMKMATSIAVAIIEDASYSQRDIASIVGTMTNEIYKTINNEQ